MSTVDEGGPEPWIQAAIEQEEKLLARIAEAYGAGMNGAQIARYLGVPAGLVADVLRCRRPVP